MAVVIVNYRTPDLALECAASLEPERARVPDLEVVVVDGGSADGSAEKIRQGLAAERFGGWARLLALDFNGGFGWANNQAMLRLLQSGTPPDFIHLLNPDSVIELGAVQALAQELERHPQCAAAGSQLVAPDGDLAGSAFRFPTMARELVRGSYTAALGKALGIAPVLVDPGTAGEVDWVAGASCMLRSAALRETGLFDDGFFLYFEEIELMHRMRRAGWTVRHVPRSRVVHLGGASTGVNGHDPALFQRRPAYWYRSRRRYFARTGGAAAAAAAGTAWLAGQALFGLRRAVGSARDKVEVPHERRDLIEHGLWPSASDRVPAIVDWRAAPDLPPAWTRFERSA